MANPPGTIARNLLTIYKAAADSNDGERCMIGPSPVVKNRLKKDLKKLKKLSANNVLSNLLTPKQASRVGMNDGLVQPGNVFPLGASAVAVRNRSARRAPLRGAVKVAVVLVDFPDKKMRQNQKQFADLFFSDKKGSVRHYFKEVSGNAVQIEGIVIGPFTLPHKITEYAQGASGTGSIRPNARTMAEHAATAATHFVDFRPFDNDSDGFVDAFVVVHAGSGAEQTGNINDIWSHKWVLPTVYPTDNNQIYGYLTVPEDCRLGVCAQELGHLLFGFPDLYDTDYTSEGVGDWCLMGGGSWNDGGLTPAYPCAWCKIQQGWAMVVNQTKNEEDICIGPVQKSKTIYRL